MPSGESELYYENPHPDVLVRERKCVVRLRARRSGSIVTLKSTTTCAVYGPDGVKVADATCTVDTDGSILGSVAAADLPATLGIGAGYQLYWSPVENTGTVAQPSIDRECYLALRPLYCPVSDADFEIRYPGISTKLLTGASITHFGGFIDAAFAQAMRELTLRGLWPHQVKSQWSLFLPILEDALANTWSWAYSKSRDQSHQSLAEKHRRAAGAAWGALATTLDRDDDGRPDDPEHMESGAVVLHVNAAPYRTFQSNRW